MFRPLTLSIALTLVAVACSGDNAAEVRATYFQDAAALSATYETAASELFDGYLVSLQSATAETGDAIFVDASKGLFAGLASEFETAVSGFNGLKPPDDVEALHDEWVAAAEELYAVFQGADRDLSPLADAPAVDSILSVLPVADLQSAYRSACDAVANLTTADDPATISCRPPEGT